MAIPSMSRLGALKISLENDLVHIYAKWGSSSSLRTDFPPAPQLLENKPVLKSLWKYLCN